MQGIPKKNPPQPPASDASKSSYLGNLILINKSQCVLQNKSLPQYQTNTTPTLFTSHLPILLFHITAHLISSLFPLILCRRSFIKHLVLPSLRLPFQFPFFFLYNYATTQHSPYLQPSLCSPQPQTRLRILSPGGSRSRTGTTTTIRSRNLRSEFRKALF